jgi:hypothetical protein
VGASRYLIGLLLAVAVGLAVYAMGHRLMRDRSPVAAGARVEGFAGWLLVLAVGQWLAALSLFGNVLRHMPLYQSYLAMPETRTAAIVEVAGHLALLAFVLWAAMLMTRKSRLYPRLLRLELVMLVVLPAFNIAWVTEETGTYVTGPKLWIAVTLRFVATGIFAALWFIYSQHSLRVRDTFVR